MGRWLPSGFFNAAQLTRPHTSVLVRCARFSAFRRVTADHL